MSRVAEKKQKAGAVRVLKSSNGGGMKERFVSNTFLGKRHK